MDKGTPKLPKTGGAKKALEAIKKFRNQQPSDCLVKIISEYGNEVKVEKRKGSAISSRKCHDRKQKRINTVIPQGVFMIKNEKEYLESKARLDIEFKELDAHADKMKKSGLTPEQIKLALDPLASFALQLKEEVEEYEKLKRGQFDILENFNGIGRMLVALRIFKGLKQKELAEKLDVTEAQVSRDERNEYHGASIEKIQKVLEALGVTLKSAIEIDYKDAV